MQLLDRYLARIRYNLPAARADDIVNELRDDLLDQIEAQESKLGRPLEESEIGALLVAFGHPLVIASRYRKHQSLIGPESYPFYLYGLRVVLVIALIVLVFAGLIPLLTGGDDPVAAFFSGLERAYTTFILGFAWVTIVFAVGERIAPRGMRLDVWKPEGLPPVVDQKPRGKWTSPIEVGFNLLFLIWWAARLPFPFFGLSSGIDVHATPIWSAIYWPVLALSVALIAGNVLDWLRPAQVRLRLALALVTTAGALWAVSYLRGHGPWVTVSAAGHSAAQLADIARGLNGAVLIILTIGLFAWGIRAVTLVYQLYLRRFMLGR